MRPGAAMLSRMAEILELLRRPFELGSLLVERPIKIGDRIDVGGLEGQGIEIPYPQRDLYVKEFPAATAARTNPAGPG
jgi:small-conductance mechanosensitive channel